jgi:hypothetical protein
VSRDPVWGILAYAFLLSHASHLKIFTSEDLRVLARAKGFRAPDNARAWGPIIQQAADAGLAKDHAMVRPKLPDARGRKIRQWRWVGWA